MPPLTPPLLLQKRQGRVSGFMAADLVFFHDPVYAPRPAWWRAVSAIAVALLGLAPFTIGDALAPPKSLGWSDKHRNSSLEIALNRAFCGTESKLSTSFPVAQYLEDHPELRDAPLRDVAGMLAGSASEYCRSVVRPFLNSENSLMLAMTLFLTADPRLSLGGLGWCLQASRIAALLIFAYFLLENGSSLAFAAFLLSLSLGILGYLGATTYYSIYPFLPVLLLLTVALLSLSLQQGLALRRSGHVVVAGLAGWLVAFAVNMRTSHLPVYMAFLAFYFVASHRLVGARRQPWPRGSQVRWLGAAILSASIGYGLFGLLFIRPLTKDRAGGPAYSHHPVAHALVLGLAVPESALSHREGIAWDDAVGITLARRIDPQVSYLQEGYESALFRYYGRLWSQHPWEMLEIYLSKLKVSGRSMVLKVSGSPMRALVWPLSWIPNGLALLVLYATVLWVSLIVHSRLGSPLAFTVALIMAAGVLLQLECVVIYPLFDMTHYSSQLLCFLLLAALTWQMVLEGLRLAVQSALDRRRGEREQVA